MNRLRLLGLWMLLMPLLAVASELDAGKWVAEDASGKFRMTATDGVTEIVAPDGLTLWYDERLTGNYEISYRIQVVMDGGRYDRLSDMNCFWGAADPEHPDDIYARGKWRAGVFKNYNTLNLFYVGYGGNHNSTTRFRVYHGEYYGQGDDRVKPLLKEYTDGPHLLSPNRWYEVVITVADGRTTYAVDGEVLFSHSLEKGQADGYFALRLLKNRVRVSDFTVRKAEAQFAFTNYRRYYREARERVADEKTEAVGKLRDYFFRHPHRAVKPVDEAEAARMYALLGEDGTFSDLNPTEEQYNRENVWNRGYANTPDDRAGIFIADALNRVYRLAEAARRGSLKKDTEFLNRLSRAVVHYGNLEIVPASTLPALPSLRRRSTSILPVWRRWTGLSAEKPVPKCGRPATC